METCFYHHSSSHREVEDVVDELLQSGFNKVQPFSRSQEDAGPFLRGEVNAKSVAGKLKGKKKTRGKK